MALFAHMLEWWFGRITQVLMEKEEVLEIAGIRLAPIPGLSLKDFIELRQYVMDHVKQAERGNLDPRYTVYKTLRLIQNG